MVDILLWALVIDAVRRFVGAHRLVIAGLWEDIDGIMTTWQHRRKNSKQKGFLGAMMYLCSRIASSLCDLACLSPGPFRADEYLPDKITEGQRLLQSHHHPCSPDNATEISMPLICPTIAPFPKNCVSQARDSPAKQQSRKL
jgi:hypothetical protein